MKSLYPAIFLSGCLVSASLQGAVSGVFLVSVVLVSVILVFVDILRNCFGKYEMLVAVASFVCSLIYMVVVWATLPPGIGVFSADFLSILLKFIIGPCSLYFSYRLDWDRRIMRFIFILTFVAFVILFTLFQVKNGMVTGLVLFNLHSNYLGLLCMLGVVVSLLFRVDKGRSDLLSMMLFFSSFVGLIFSVSRSSLVSLVFACIVYLFASRIRLIYRPYILYPAVVFSLVFVAFTFSYWVKSDSAMRISEVMEDVAGKRLDTGRSKLWEFAINEIEEHLILGTGIYARDSWDRRLSDGSYITLSVHNYYLAILMEAGVIGFMSVFVLLYIVFRNVFDPEVRLARLTVALFLSILVHQSAEVSLTTGTYTAGALIWFIFGICIKMTFSEMSRNQHHFDLADYRNYRNKCVILNDKAY